MAANLMARFWSLGLCCRDEGPAARKIINICSIASDLGRPNIVPYPRARRDQMLTRPRRELAPANIR